MNLTVRFTGCQLFHKSSPSYRLSLGCHTAMLYRPHFSVSWLRLFLLTCQRSGTNRSVAMYMYVSVWAVEISLVFPDPPRPQVHTSTVSSTLTTPGCRIVRSFFNAFLARGSRDLFAVMSNAKMLQLEPSSCVHLLSKAQQAGVWQGRYEALPCGCHCARTRWTGPHPPCRPRYKGRVVPWQWQMQQPT